MMAKFYCGLLLIVSTAIRFADSIELNLHSGVHHVEIKGAILFRGKINLNYVVDFPRIKQEQHDLENSLKECNKLLKVHAVEESGDEKTRQKVQLCQYMLSMKRLQDESFDLIDSLSTNFGEKSRSKRSVSVLSILSWIGESLFGSGEDSDASKIMTSEAKLAERIRFLRFNEESRNERENQDFGQINAWSENVTDVLGDITKHMFNAESALLSEETTQGQITAFLSGIVSSSLAKQVAIVQFLKEREILRDCMANKIPVQAINFKRLRSDLENVSINLQNKSVKLSIDKANEFAYLNEKLAVCRFSGTKLHLKIAVPIMFNGDSDMKVLSIFPVNFVWKNEQCTLLRQAVLGIWSPSRKVFSLFRDEASKQCYGTGLCHIPRLLATDACLSNLFAGYDIKDLSPSCSFVCDSHSPKTRAVRIDEDVFYVSTLARSLQLNCSGNERDISAPEAGAMKIHVNCNCSLHDGAHEVISPTFPCGGDKQTYGSEIVLPALWSNENVASFTLNGSHNLLKLFRNNASEIVNEQWKEEVRHLNLQPPSTMAADSVDWKDDYIYYASHAGVGGSTLLTIVILYFTLRAVHRYVCKRKVVSQQTVPRDHEYDMIPLRTLSS